MAYFLELEEIILKLVQNHKKSSPKKMNKQNKIKKKNPHRYREQISGYQRGRELGVGEIGNYMVDGIQTCGGDNSVMNGYVEL